MKARITLLTTAALTLGAYAGTALADSTPAEFRGYQACLEANSDAFEGLVPQRNYLLSDTDAGQTYYINATAWENGERIKVSFSCDTTDTGRLISNQGVSYNHFVAATDPSVQVAGN